MKTENKKNVKIIDFEMNFNLQVDGEFLIVKVRENSGFTELEYFPKNPANQKELIEELLKLLKKKVCFLIYMIEKKLVKKAGGNDLNELKGSFFFICRHF